MAQVHIAITRQVKPGMERAFEDALQEFASESLSAPGTSDMHMIGSVPGTIRSEYGILRSFESETECQAFTIPRCFDGGTTKRLSSSSADGLVDDCMDWRNSFVTCEKGRRRSGRWQSSPGSAYFLQFSFGHGCFRNC